MLCDVYSYGRRLNLMNLLVSFSSASLLRGGGNLVVVVLAHLQMPFFFRHSLLLRTGGHALLSKIAFGLFLFPKIPHGTTLGEAHVNYISTKLE